MGKRPLENVAAKLDDIAETVDELKGDAEDGAAIDERKLTDIEGQLARAADAIEDAVDPD